MLDADLAVPWGAPAGQSSFPLMFHAGKASSSLSPLTAPAHPAALKKPFLG